MTDEPLDLDALEAQQDVRVNGRSYGPVEPIAALIAECRALHAEVALVGSATRAKIADEIAAARYCAERSWSSYTEGYLDGLEIAERIARGTE